MAGLQPTVRDDERVLRLTAQCQKGSRVYFNLNYTTPFRALMRAYCKKTGVNLKVITFLFDGSRLDPNQTPQDVSEQPVFLRPSLVDLTRSHFFDVL
jgi:hypothetical protein